MAEIPLGVGESLFILRTSSVMRADYVYKTLTMFNNPVIDLFADRCGWVYECLSDWPWLACGRNR